MRRHGQGEKRRGDIEKFRMVFRATPGDVRKTLDRFCSHIRPLSLPAEYTGTLELVLAEVLNNVVEHAYGNRGDGWIELCATMLDNGFAFEVVDEGAEMPEQELPRGDPRLLGGDLNALPEGGFGWFLIRDLAQDLSYERRNERNYLAFRICRNIPAARQTAPCETGCRIRCR